MTHRTFLPWGVITLHSRIIIRFIPQARFIYCSRRQLLLQFTLWRYLWAIAIIERSCLATVNVWVRVVTLTINERQFRRVLFLGFFQQFFDFILCGKCHSFTLMRAVAWVKICWLMVNAYGVMHWVWLLRAWHSVAAQVDLVHLKLSFDHCFLVQGVMLLLLVCFLGIDHACIWYGLSVEVLV